MAVTPPEAHPHSYARLHLLKSNLETRGFTCSLNEAGTHLLATAPNPTGPRNTAEVVCKPRQEDDGNLWYWTAWGTPLADADDVVQAALELQSLLCPAGKITPVSGPLGGINV